MLTTRIVFFSLISFYHFSIRCVAGKQNYDMSKFVHFEKMAFTGKYLVKKVTHLGIASEFSFIVFLPKSQRIVCIR